MSDLETFLAHHGIKGQKWGVRRNLSTSSDSSSGSGMNKTSTSSGKGHGIISSFRARRAAKNAVEVAKKAPPGTVGTSTKSDGTHIIVMKKADGTWEETHFSHDAETFIKATMTPQHELSNQELRTALTRAKMMKEYDDMAMFSKQTDANQELKDKVGALELQVKMSQARATLRGPSNISKAVGFAASLTPAFKAFQELDKASNGKISKKLNSQMKSAKDAFSENKKSSHKSSDSGHPKKEKKHKTKPFIVNPDKVIIRQNPDFPG